MAQQQPLISRTGVLLVALANMGFIGLAVYRGDYRIVAILLVLELFILGADVGAILRGLRGQQETPTPEVPPAPPEAPPSILDKESPR